MDALMYRTNEPYRNVESIDEARNIRKLLLNIGFPQHVYGYQYIIYALKLNMIDPEILHHITKELYPEIAVCYQSTPARVERAIRTSIQITWMYGNKKNLNTIFGNTVRPDKKIPTNTQFLAGLYFYLREKNN